ncbi:MAG TPA: glycine cleavage system protein GcvH [Ktedonobacteraceae bacterium]|jgi:glycine cleavage system H protein
MANLNHPGNLKYSKSDEWIRVEGNTAFIGITDYAQDQLGDIVYVELPWDANQQINSEEKFGDIESVKATSELFSPLSGAIIKVNGELKEHPELINDDPYDKGWMLQVQISNASEIATLMDGDAYITYIEGR